LKARIVILSALTGFLVPSKGKHNPLICYLLHGELCGSP
jgi:hypothetical protein